jgi:hypothetical protein
MQAVAENAPKGAMSHPSNRPMVLGVIVGNRGFFPDHVARTGRQEIIKALTAKGIKPVVLEESESKHGAVETRQEAARCSTGTTITQTIPTRPCASIAAICQNTFSGMCAWTSRKSSRQRWARKTRSGRAWDA